MGTSTLRKMVSAPRVMGSSRNAVVSRNTEKNPGMYTAMSRTREMARLKLLYTAQ